MTPLKAIRLNCLGCSAGSAKEVRLCYIPTCPLYQYRFGKNPALKGKRVNNLPQHKAISELKTERGTQP